MALIVQGDYRSIASDRNLLAADGILRKYFNDMGGPGEGASFFFGLGLGAAKVKFPSGSGETSHQKWWTYVAEVGYEYSPKNNLVFILKGQWRHYAHDNLDYSGWTLQLGVGLPVPW
jgi:hypothetical protein